MYNFQHYDISHETVEEHETIKFLDGNHLTIQTLIEGEFKNGNVRDLMDAIQDRFGDSLRANPTFKGDVFNWMSVDEFAEYLKCCGYDVWEEVIINYRIQKRDKDDSNK